MQRPALRRVLAIDFIYWFAFAIFQTTFALFAAQRFGFDASRTGYFFAGFGVLGAIIQGGFIRPIVKRTGDKPMFIAGVAVFDRRPRRRRRRAFGRAVCDCRSCRWRSGWGSATRRCRAWSAAQDAATNRAACRARRAQ